MHLKGEMKKTLASQLSHYFPILFKLRGFMPCPVHYKGAAFKPPEGNGTEIVPLQIRGFSVSFGGRFCSYFTYIFSLLPVLRKASHFKVMQLQLLFQNSRVQGCSVHRARELTSRVVPKDKYN